MLDFRMESFLAVCRHMNYTRAAEELNLSQPAVSQHIRWLEEYYAAPLFHYTNKRLSLTPAGQLLLTAATTVQHDQAQLKRQMQQTLQHPQDLRFGVTPTVGMYLLPGPLAKYHRTYPQANLFLQVNNTQSLCQQLDRGELDFAIVEGYVRKRDYDTLLYCSEPYLAVCAADYPLEREPKCLADLLGHPLIIREPGSGNREIITRSLNRSNLDLSDFRGLLEVGDMHVLKQLLLMGCGIGFLYRCAVAEDLAQGRLRALHLQDMQERNDITFLWRKGSVFAQDYQRLFQLLRPEVSENHTCSSSFQPKSL